MSRGPGPEPPERDLPKDPAEYRPPRMFGPSFWAMVALGLLLPLAGYGLAVLGPKLLPPKPSMAPAAPVRQSALEAAPAAPAASVVPPGQVEQLQARIADLESRRARSTEAAAAALAAAGVIDASRSSRPFAGEIEALRRAAPDLPELAALSRVAAVGAPSRAALARSFPEFAARAAVRARRPADDAGLGARLGYEASKVVQIRRVDDLTGSSPDALIARAELALADGDVLAALRLLDRLPLRARAALAPWREGAERRAEIDRQVAALRARALADLSPQGPRA
jgi:hypothetical protein